MKMTRLIYLMSGFVAGVVYVAACGGTSNSVASTIGNAVDVAYDNVASALSATNVQDAIDEVVARITALETCDDISAKVVGVWSGKIYGISADHSATSITIDADGTYTCDQSKNCVGNNEGTWTVGGNTLFVQGFTDDAYLVNYVDDQNLGYSIRNYYLWLTKQ